MTDKKLKYCVVFMAMLLLITMANATQAEDHQTSSHNLRLETVSSSSVVFYPMRQEFVDSFERTDLAPWTSTGLSPWIIRDTTDVYGPETCAVSGYRYAGFPNGDIPFYPGNQTSRLITPTIDLTGWDSLYLSFVYWADFEGAATNFDGGILEISPDNGTTWLQIDSLAQGHLNPTYDDTLVGTGQIGTPWAYCWDTWDWVDVSSMDLIGLGYVATGDQIQIRYTFDSDDLSGGQGWFIDDVRIADTSPPDLQAPIIVHTPLPDTADTVSNYTITATITDGGTGVDPDSIILHYEIESGPILDVYMTLVSTDTYEADIPAQSWHTDIWYYIMAADYAGNWAQTQTYNFEVTNARTIVYDDGQPWYAPNVTGPGDGCFVRFLLADAQLDSGLLHQAKFLFEGAGGYDLRVYEGTSGFPGAFIDSMAGLMSPSYDWQTVDITDLDIRTSNPNGIVVGYIIAPGDSLGLLRDPTLDYASQNYDYVAGQWAYGTAGDYMLRLKVIPLPLVGIEEQPGTPINHFVLSQISSNPTKTDAVIEYQLPTAQQVSLRIYDTSGQLVKTLIEQHVSAGTHQVTWNRLDDRGKEVASGVYFYRLQGENQSAAKKLILVH